MKHRQRRERKEMISTVELAHTEIVLKPGPWAERWRQVWMTCQCAVLGHDAPARLQSQWLLCSRCGKLVGGE